MASDPERARLNFINSLQKLHELIGEEEKKIKQLRDDQLVLNDIVDGNWN